MLMSDCLGGNAKTLMLVNVSPTDANLDESQNSLVYATRVRTIKNNALRDEANKEVIRWVCFCLEAHSQCNGPEQFRLARLLHKPLSMSQGGNNSNPHPVRGFAVLRRQ